MKKFLLSCFLALGMSATAQTYFSDNFNDSSVSDWTRYDQDGDGNQWGDLFQVNDDTGAPVTPISLISRSWQGAALTPNNWIVSPAIDLSTAIGKQVMLNWKVMAAAAAWDNEHYSVYVATQSDLVSLAASPVTFSETYDDPANLGTQYARTLDLTSFAGQTVYVAFRHHNVTDMDFISIDDVVVKSPDSVAPNCPTLTLPANAATGVIISPTLTWSAPATGPAPDSYDVYLGTTPNPTTLLRNVTTTSTVATGLLATTTYYWRVVSKNTAGDATSCSEFSFTTKAATPPACVTGQTPADGATGVAYGTTPLSWTAAATATSYDIYWGASPTTLSLLGNTTAIAVNITNTTANTTYYWQVVAKNADGSATGCAIYSLTTMANPFIPYCAGGLVYSSGIEPITSVKLNDMTNTSSPTIAGAVAHENFISKVATVEQGKTYPIVFEGNTNGASFANKFIVFIDWNQDGDFLDAGETYFGTAATNVVLTGSTGADGKTATGNIVVPAGATLGNTRMRIKKSYGTSFYLSPCFSSGLAATATTGTAAYGQAEDYTINVTVPVLGVSNTDNSALSVYPNPFQDVLKISDVKGVKSISISDISGRQVKSMKASTELNLSELKTGLYIVNLNMEDGTVRSIKAIKK